MAYNPEHGPPQDHDEYLQNAHYLLAGNLFYSLAPRPTGIHFSVNDIQIDPRLMNMPYGDLCLSLTDTMDMQTIGDLGVQTLYRDYLLRVGLYMRESRSYRDSHYHPDYDIETSEDGKENIELSESLIAIDGAPTITFEGLARNVYFNARPGDVLFQLLEGKKSEISRQEWYVFYKGSLHRAPRRRGRPRAFARATVEVDRFWPVHEDQAA